MIIMSEEFRFLLKHYERNQGHTNVASMLIVKRFGTNYFWIATLSVTIWLRWSNNCQNDRWKLLRHWRRATAISLRQTWFHCVKNAETRSGENTGLRGDMIETFKILTGVYDTEVTNNMFEIDENSRTRGHKYKLNKNAVCRTRMHRRHIEETATSRLTKMFKYFQ